MTSRQRQVTESGSATLTVSKGVEKGPESALPFSWNEWFRHANPQQRAAALGLAQQQGLVYPHQLPAVHNGVHPVVPTSKDTAVSALLGRLISGKADTLLPLSLEASTFHDRDLDGLQQQAVVRAIATPDVFVLQGLPGTGKSRVVAEIVHQLAARGRRVLFLGARTASVDVVLERLVGRSDVFALRLLETQEKIETLPAWLRGFTLDEQKQAFLERVLAGARGNREEADSACRAHRAEEPLWAELQACLDRHVQLVTRIREIDDQAPRLPEMVAQAAETPGDAPLHRSLAVLRERYDADVAALELRRQTLRAAQSSCDAEQTDLASRIAALEPGYLAKKHARFWTVAFWANLFNSRIIPEMEALLAKQFDAQTRRQALNQQIGEHDRECQTRRDRYAADRAAILAEETEARRSALMRGRLALQADLHQLDVEWKERCRRLDASEVAKTPEALAAAHQVWLRKKRLGEERCQFAHQWSQFVDETGPQLAARLPSFVNVLAGTWASWQGDAKLQAAVGAPVDVVVIEDADALTEADLLKLARYAHRCILVSNALTEATAEPAPRIHVATPLANLWHTLGGDAGGWQCTWRREQGRLLCQLMPLSAEDRQHLETECVADATEIELSILHRPRSRPFLAQVAFPPTSSFADAFTYMVREVQEFPLQPLGRCAWWRETADHIERHLGPTAPVTLAWFDIEPGVRLGVLNDTRVARIDFAKAAGWDLAKAESWLQRHRPSLDNERTVFLQRAYRFLAPLESSVQAVVRTSDWLPSCDPACAAESCAFEFVAVPTLLKTTWPREGAGLELDLAASRYTDRLPTALRQGLPPRGFVNYTEAQALIRRLETFAQKDVNGHPCRIAVLALYEGQVELLRRLITQSDVLRNIRYPLEVTLPSRMCQRECDVVFLSLTRSHGHRAVAFGEDVRDLPLALTRARSRLFVFGDPGTLSKRATWHGPLDHLDAYASHQELVRLSRLVSLVQSQTSVPVHSNGKERA